MLDDPCVGVVVSTLAVIFSVFAIWIAWKRG